MPRLIVEELSISFIRYRGILGRERIIGLRDFSIAVEPGEVFGVVGASGAGKSLLAHAILAILPQNARIDGRMTIDGVAITPATAPHLRGRRIALAPQSVAYLDPLARVGMQLRWAAQRAGATRADAMRLAGSALRDFGLDERVGQAFPHELSGGMARRVIVAMATIGGADLIIADEPTTGLDAGNASAVFDAFRRLANLGRSVILITHDLEAALPVTDRVAILHDGLLQEVAPRSAFAASSGLTSDYGQQLWNALPGNAFSADNDAIGLAQP